MPDCRYCNTSCDDDRALAEHLASVHEWDELSEIDRQRVEKLHPEMKPDTGISDRLGIRLQRTPLAHAVTRRRLLYGTALTVGVGGGWTTWNVVGDTVRSVLDLEDTWNELESLPIPAGYPAVEAYRESIYVFGGLGAFDVTQIYDTESDEWRTGPDLPELRSRATATSFNEYIYLIGGLSRDFEPTDTVFRYDPAEDTWEDGFATKPTPIRDNSISATDGRRIYVPAGTTGDTDETDVFEAYDPKTDRWETEYADVPIPIRQHTTEYTDGRLYITGGESGGEDAAHHYEYDIDADTWSEKTPRPIAVHAHSAGIIDGSLFVTGGHTHDGEWDDGAPHHHRYDIDTDTWERMADFPEPRDTHTAAVIGNRYVTIGGRTYLEGDPMDTVERYNAANG